METSPTIISYSLIWQDQMPKGFDYEGLVVAYLSISKVKESRPIGDNFKKVLECALKTIRKRKQRPQVVKNQWSLGNKKENLYKHIKNKARIR